MNINEFMSKNTALRHAIQTGIEYERNDNYKLTDGKHLRTGLNANMVEVAALSHLLLRKGIINEEELFDISIEFLEKEVREMEIRLSEKYGVNIHLV